MTTRVRADARRHRDPVSRVGQVPNKVLPSAPPHVPHRPSLFLPGFAPSGFESAAESARPRREERDETGQKREREIELADRAKRKNWKMAGRERGFVSNLVDGLERSRPRKFDRHRSNGWTGLETPACASALPSFSSALPSFARMVDRSIDRSVGWKSVSRDGGPREDEVEEAAERTATGTTRGGEAAGRSGIGVTRKVSER